MLNKFYITTTIPYANADPHIGFALEILYADIMARYRRLLGDDVYFLTGTDEHGQKMLKTAKEAGQPVEKFAAEKSAKFQSLADQCNISNNDFIRTTEERHIKRAKKFWELAQKNGDIYKKQYSGLYCVGCESFKTEKDLMDGKCSLHNTAPEILTEENYFFRLSRFQKSLEKLFKKNKSFVYPASRYNEMQNVLRSGLEDISISREKKKLPWGIEVPGDAEQVMYVWFDALTNYITALGWGSADESLFKKYWPADAHVVGKDVNRFHSLLWPAMLLSVGIDLPKQIAVHGFIYVDGQKMSKSLGNVVNPDELSAKYPLDSVRYFFAREIPFDNDGDFTNEKFVERYNADLANGIGNLTSRVLTMVEKTGGVVPAAEKKNAKWQSLVTKTWKEYAGFLAQWRFDRALETVWKFVSFCDQTISEKQPWKMVKQLSFPRKRESMSELEDLLFYLCESLRQIAVMLLPFMPDTTDKIFVRLGLDAGKELAKSFSELRTWTDISGNKISKGEPLFPRI
ncbi:methionine--tRNA ligase [Patescibacteria group bacterium]|nr:MAG: methionine--tRNA ligase [Patescibacteria group bacterium]